MRITLYFWSVFCAELPQPGSEYFGSFFINNKSKRNEFSAKVHGATYYKFVGCSVFGFGAVGNQWRKWNIRGKT